MNTEQVTESLTRRVEHLERELDTLLRRANGVGVWLSTAQAASDLGKSRKAFWQWCKRKGVVIHNGFVARRDIERAIERKRK